MRGLWIAGTIWLIGPSLFAAEPWHLPGWGYRARVSVPQPNPEADVDTAGVTLHTLGRAAKDGADFRVVDVNGKSLPFQLHFHDPERTALLAFRCPDPKQVYFIYFGNPQATRSPEMITTNRTPGSGPPTGDWVPKFGFVLETMARPRAADITQETNPETVEQMVKLLQSSPGPHGAAFVRNIADGYNRFGPSEYYISAYRGWIRIPRAGKYRFCTASNEASFSFLDGKTLIHWPGRHTAARGERGEINTTIELTAGYHYLEYYHEEVTLEQMAFLGWRESGDEGAFTAIPDAIFTAPHSAIVDRYESPKGPALAMQPTITDSIWPIDRSAGQYTRATFEVPTNGQLGEGTVYRWDFGDGQSATGTRVEHVFLAVGQYPITLTATGPAGTQSVKWPLHVFDIEHITAQFREGRPTDYANIVLKYDRSTLPEASLRELAYLFAESEQPADTVLTVNDFVKRFPNAPALTLARLRRLSAEANLRLGGAGIDEAIKNYQAALVPELTARERLGMLRQLVRLVGIERQDADKALSLSPVIDNIARNERLDDEGRTAFRHALIALGDVELWRGRRDEAMKHYRKVEAMRGVPIPPQVRAAKLGAYPNSLQEYLDAGNFGAAIDLLTEWETLFPTDKVNGQWLHWRGKVLLLRGQAREAQAYLSRALLVTEGAPYETESRWLLGLALEQSGQMDAAKREWLKLVQIGLEDDFVRKARTKLAGKP